MKAGASAPGCSLSPRFHRVHLGHADSILKPVLLRYDEAHVIKPQKTRQELTRRIYQVSRPLTRQGPHMGLPDTAFPHDPALSAVELPESPTPSPLSRLLLLPLPKPPSKSQCNFSQGQSMLKPPYTGLHPWGSESGRTGHLTLTSHSTWHLMKTRPSTCGKKEEVKG